MAANDLLHDPWTGNAFERIAVFRALQLGDLLCATPALRTLRRALPNAHVTLIGLPWAREFASIYDSYIDDFVSFPGFPGLPERAVDLETWPEFLMEVRSRRFDLAIQMHGAGTLSNSIVGLFGARFTAGFRTESQTNGPDPSRYLVYPAASHEVWRHLSLMRFLGAEPAGEDLDYQIVESDVRELLDDPRARELLGAKFVCLHPGARAASRRWAPEKFAAVADQLTEEGYAIVLTGSETERPLGASVLANMKRKSRIFNFMGRTRLRTLAVLLDWSELVICNDTGVSHLAVALQKPSVVIFLNSEMQGWPPLNRRRHRVVSRLNGPEPEDVLNEAADLMRGDHASLEDIHMARSRKLPLVSQPHTP